MCTQREGRPTVQHGGYMSWPHFSESLKITAGTVPQSSHEATDGEQ